MEFDIFQEKKYRNLKIQIYIYIYELGFFNFFQE
jgi:hypothetical protein